MTPEVAAALRKLADDDQSEAVVAHIAELWEVDPFIRQALTSLAVNLGRPPTEEESDLVLSWVIESVVRWRLLDGFMHGAWSLIGLTPEGHPTFGDFKTRGGANGAG